MAWRPVLATLGPLLGLAGTLLLASGAARAQSDEVSVKAAFLYRFIQFTEWPVPPTEPFVLCVLGHTPMDEALSRLSGKAVLNGLRITVQHLQPRDPLAGCHALYLDDSQRRKAEELLPRLAGAPILTVTDSDGLADRGLMIELRKRDLKLGFDVNLQAVRASGMSLSSRLLKLASFVGGTR